MGKKGTCSTCGVSQTDENSGTRRIKSRVCFLANCRSCERIRMNRLNARRITTSQLQQRIQAHRELLAVLEHELGERQPNESA